MFMHIGGLKRTLALSSAALLMVVSTAAEGRAQSHEDHDHALAVQPQRLTSQQNELVQTVRQVTERFKDVSDVAGPGEGYVLSFGCVSGGDFGAMGLHYVNMGLVGDGDIKAETPEIVLFEPTANGGIRITGVDYLVTKADWEAHHPGEGPPMLMGQLFHLFDSPNRFGLDPFYTLHVWAWKENPNGTFVNWNPNVSCDGFNPPPPVQQ
jgi:hypothetical protein